MVIKLFFLLLVLGTVAVVAVILAIHFHVKRHLSQTSEPPASSESVPAGTEEQASSATEGAAKEPSEKTAP